MLGSLGPGIRGATEAHDESWIVTLDRHDHTVRRAGCDRSRGANLSTAWWYRELTVSSWPTNQALGD